MSVNSTGDYSTALVDANFESSTHLEQAAADPDPSPPVAKKIRCEHEAHGEKRFDDYHWLRNKDDPDTIPYLEKWNAYTSRMMEPLKPLTETLYHEFLGRMEANSKSVPYQLGPYFYYIRMEEGKNYPIFCRTPSGEELEQVLLDGNDYASALPYFAVKAMEPSPDGRYVAYTIDSDGSQFGKIVILDTQSGKFLDEKIENSNGSIVWNSRSDSFWYTRVNEEYRADRAYVHAVGTKTDSDLLVREEADSLYDIRLGKDKHDRYLILTSTSKDTSEVSMGSLDDPGAPFALIHPREKGLKYFIVPGDHTHYIMVSKDKANWGLYQAPRDQLSKEHWVEVIPSTQDVDLAGIEVFKDYLAVMKRFEGLKQVEIRSLVDGSVHEVVMPQAIGDIDFEHNDGWDTPLLRFTYDSPITPLATYHYDMGDRTLTLLKQKKAGDFNSDLYTSERILASANDGTQVPISLFYKKGLKRDGSEPLYLYGYGSYGVTFDPCFSGINASLLERGVCFAIAHVRGGGDLGRQWYQQGSMMNKRNTFTDFINCAEHLIKQGYTSPESLAIAGGSAGGLLMGAVVNMRPDLFKVCMAKVPFVDVLTTMFDESLPLTTQEWVEWGNPNQVEHYQYMKGYSPYDNVEAKSYPAMYVVAGLNDKQVSYHEPAKWVAKLMEFKTDSNPLLFRVNMGAGHHGASGRYAAYEERAPEIAFVLKHLGF